MKIITCPMTDSKPHEIFSSSCECGCNVEFLENGDMLITHNAHDIETVEAWGIFEEDKQ